MRITTLLMVLVFLVAGCGYNPEEPIYDTTSNPDNFPREACALIDLVEADEVNSIDRANAEFAKLYTSHPELLDNSSWLVVISRLGAKYLHRADSLFQIGPMAYDRAGEYYTLASFARPEDARARERAAAFSVWYQARQDSLIAFDLRSAPADLDDLVARLDAYRFFLSGDSIASRFAAEDIPSAFFTGPESQRLNPDLIEGLSPTDRCLLATRNLAEVSDFEPAGAFDDPLLSLVDYEVSRLEGNTFRAELYFRPEVQPRYNWTVAMQVIELDSIPGSDIRPALRMPVTIEPHPVTSTWGAGAVQAVVQVFEYSGTVDKIQLGFFRQQTGRKVDGRIVGGNSPYLELPVSGDPGRTR